MSDKINQQILEALKIAQLELFKCGASVDSINDVLRNAEPHVTWVVDTKTGRWERRPISKLEPADQPTREELIDALRRAEQLLSRPGRPYVEEMRDRVIFNEILAKCDPKPEPIRRWLVESPDHPSVGLGRAKITIVMPITRLQIEEATNKSGFYPANINMRGMQKAELFLQALGIQVED